MSSGQAPLDDNYHPALALMNDATGKIIPVHVGSTIIGSDGQTYAVLDVNASVSPPASVVSTTNSSTTLLATNATFTGASESILPYGSISVQAYSDRASAASGLIVEQSQDGTSWDTQAAYSVSAATAFQATVNATGKFYRVLYTNGPTDQTVFRLQTIKEVAASPSAGVANQRVSMHAGDVVSGAFLAGALADGADVTQGISTDANTVNSVMGRLTKIRDLLLGFVFDSTDKLRASLYVKTSAAGDTVLTLGRTNKAGSLPVTMASDQDNINVAVNAALPAGTNVIGHTIVDSGAITETNSAASKADLDTMVPGVQGWIAATGTGTATTDDAIAFSQQVRTVVLYNSATVPVPFEFDQTATANSFPIQPGQYMVFDSVLCTNVHVFPSATLTFNTAGGLYVKGWK